jgi:hypothetical protein
MTKTLTHNRVDIKAILADPLLREELIEGAVDFICKVEGIRREEDLKMTDLSSAAIAAELEAQPEPQGPTDAASRIAHYLEQRRLIRGLDSEVINALHAGTNEPRQAALTVSDLEVLTRYACPTAQPEPQGPTDKELWDLYQDLGRDFSPTEFARTVLARWGRSAIEPVPGVEGSDG